MCTKGSLTSASRLLSTTPKQSSVLRRYDAPRNIAQQQCAFKKSKAKGGGKGGKKGQLSQLNPRLIENLMPDQLNIVEVAHLKHLVHPLLI